MSWLRENWGWLAAAAAIFVIIFIVTKVLERRRKLAEARAMFEAMMRVVATFDSIVQQVLGNQYSSEDRHKIAAGMMAVAMAREIPVARIAGDKQVFTAVLIESIRFLTAEHQITAPR